MTAAGQDGERGFGEDPWWARVCRSSVDPVVWWQDRGADLSCFTAPGRLRAVKRDVAATLDPQAQRDGVRLVWHRYSEDEWWYLPRAYLGDLRRTARRSS